MHGRTRIVSIVDDKTYTIVTRGSPVQEVSVRGDDGREIRNNLLPSDIRAIKKDPFATALITLLAADVPVTLGQVQALVDFEGGRVHLNTQGEGWMTALMHACHHAPHIIPFLTQSDTSLVDSEGWTALRWALESGNAEDLVAHFPSLLPPNSQDIHGRTLLMRAVINENVSAARALASITGIDPTLVDKTNGHSVVTFIMEKIKEGARFHSADLVNVMVAIAHIPGVLRPDIMTNNRTLLMWAIIYENWTILEQVLRMPNLTVNHQEPQNGFTVLMLACMRKDFAECLELVQRLIQLPGILPNVTNNLGQTALMVACRYGASERVIQALRSMPGIDPNIRDRNGATALRFRYVRDWGSLAELANFEGIDPNVQDRYGMTVLMLDPDSENYRNIHPIDNLLATFTDIDRNIRDNLGLTALAHFANLSVLDATAGVQALMKWRCDASIATDDGYTPLSILIHHGNVNGLRVLFRSNQPLGIMSVHDWVNQDYGRVPSLSLMIALRQCIKGRIADVNDDIGRYYANYREEQDLLRQIDTMAHQLSTAMSSLTNSKMDDIVSQLQEMKSQVLFSRRHLATAYPRYPNSIPTCPIARLGDYDLHSCFISTNCSTCCIWKIRMRATPIGNSVECACCWRCFHPCTQTSISRTAIRKVCCSDYRNSSVFHIFWRRVT